MRPPSRRLAESGSVFVRLLAVPHFVGIPVHDSTTAERLITQFRVVVSRFLSGSITVATDITNPKMAYAIAKTSSAPDVPQDVFAFRNDMRSDAIQEVTVHRRRSLEGTESSDGYDGTYHQKKRSQSLTLPNSSAKVGVYSPDLLYSSASRRNSLPISRVNEEAHMYVFSPQRGASSYNGEVPSYSMTSSVRPPSIRSNYSVVHDSHNPNHTIAHISKSSQRSCSKRNSLRTTPTPEVDSRTTTARTQKEEEESQRRFLQNLSKPQLCYMLDQVLHKVMWRVC